MNLKEIFCVHPFYLDFRQDFNNLIRNVNTTYKILKQKLQNPKNLWCNANIYHKR